MQRNDGVQLFPGVAGKEHFQRSFSPVTGCQSTQLFYQRDEVWIKLKAGAAERDHRDHCGILGSGRKDAGAGPGSFPSGISSVEQRDLQTCARQFEGDGAADESAAGDGGIKRSHFRTAILAQRNTTQREAASSSERTWAFLARFRARVQSPSFTACLDSCRKEVTFEVRSAWAGFRRAPLAAEGFSGGTPRFSFFGCGAERVPEA